LTDAPTRQKKKGLKSARQRPGGGSAKDYRAKKEGSVEGSVERCAAGHMLTEASPV